jgi:Na+-transporting methylmalonyl-CoA/oxaloacetate decarboxylase gamma subunit
MTTKTRKLLRDDSGVALVLALLMLVALTLIGLGAIVTSTFEVKLSGNQRGATDAFYAAESGTQVVLANVANFNLAGKYVDNQYNPFTDPANPNPTQAAVTIFYLPNEQGAPIGMGVSATNFDFMYYRLNASGQDQTDSGSVKTTSAMEQKVVRLVPTLQGGY